MVFDRMGFAQSRECGLQAVPCHANRAVQATSNNSIRTEELTVRHVAKATYMSSCRPRTWLHLSYRATPERVECPTSDSLSFLFAAQISCHRYRHRHNAVIHVVGLHPTRGLCLNSGLNSCDGVGRRVSFVEGISVWSLIGRKLRRSYVDLEQCRHPPV